MDGHVAGRQGRGRGAGTLASREQLGHLGRNRQLHTMARAKRKGGIGCPHAFSDHLHAGQHIGQRTAASQLEPDVAIAAQCSGACEHEITETGQARHRFTLSTGGARQPRDFRQPARDEPRLRVLPETKSFGDACSNRNHVLQCAANLDAHHVACSIQPEVRGAEIGLHFVYDTRILRGDTDSGRELPRHLRRKTRSR